MMRVVVLAQKGGVGKTITTANLGAALALDGLRVLEVDFDPQADLSASWGVADDDAVARIEDVLENGADPRGALLDRTPEGAGRLVVLPATPRLRALTAPLLEGQVGDLAGLLAELEDDFDVALVDTPAGDTIFGRQALAAAQRALVTVLPGFQELRALQRVLDEIDQQADEVGAALGLLGVLLVNAPSSGTSREYREFLRDGDFDLFRTVVPRRQPVTNHARYGLPTVLLEPDSAVAVSYRRAAREVLDRLGIAPPSDSTWNDDGGAGARRRWRPRLRRAGR